jgi:hypothetical protein
LYDAVEEAHRAFKDVPDAEDYGILDFARPLTEVTPSAWAERKYLGGKES